MTRTTTAPAPAMPPPAATAPHTVTEDAVAVFTGVLLISVGVAFFTSAGLLTGGTAGVNYLKTLVDLPLFPELWDVRTMVGPDTGQQPNPHNPHAGKPA